MLASPFVLAQYSAISVTIAVLMDQCINVVCLYLQYKFEHKLYVKCCVVPDGCCRMMITRRTKRSISKRISKVLRVNRVPSHSPTPMSPVSEMVSVEHEISVLDLKGNVIDVTLTTLGDLVVGVDQAAQDPMELDESVFAVNTD